MQIAGGRLYGSPVAPRALTKPGNDNRCEIVMTAVAVLPAGTTDKSANRLKDCCPGADESAVRRRRSRPCVKGLKERGLTTQKV